MATRKNHLTRMHLWFCYLRRRRAFYCNTFMVFGFNQENFRAVYRSTQQPSQNSTRTAYYYMGRHWRKGNYRHDFSNLHHSCDNRFSQRIFSYRRRENFTYAIDGRKQISNFMQVDSARVASEHYIRIKGQRRTFVGGYDYGRIPGIRRRFGISDYFRRAGFSARSRHDVHRHPLFSCRPYVFCHCVYRKAN